MSQWERIAELPLGRDETALVVEDEPAILMVTKMMSEQLKTAPLITIAADTRKPEEQNPPALFV